VPFDISNISVGGDSVFTQTNNCPPTLGPKQACFISLTFAPTAVQSYSATLTVSGNVNGSVPLTGSGLAVPPPTITVTPPNATGVPGQTFMFNLAPMNFTGGTPTFTANCTHVPGATCTIQGATLTVTTTAPASSMATISLLPMIGIMLVGLIVTGVKKRRAVSTLVFASLLIGLAACGGVGSSGTNPVRTVTPPGTYPIGVSATNVPTTTTIMLTIQ
jgi:hypothetical protein